MYEILNEGANALDVLAHRLAATATDHPSAVIPGTEDNWDGGDGGGAVAATVAAAAGGAGKGEEKAVGSETPWVRELFEAFMRVGNYQIRIKLSDSNMDSTRPRLLPYVSSLQFNPPHHTQATFRLGLKVHLRKLAHSPALEAYLQATGTSDRSNRVLEQNLK